MQEPYMQQIVDGEKNYEFRKYCMESSVKRVWFYRTAPHSSVEFVCEILPAATRKPGDTPLEENGLGNREFNTRHKDWSGYDFAYKIQSVYHLDSPVTLAQLRREHGIKSAPRGPVYVPMSLLRVVKWHEHKKIW